MTNESIRLRHHGSETPDQQAGLGAQVTDWFAIPVKKLPCERATALPARAFPLDHQYFTVWGNRNMGMLPSLAISGSAQRAAVWLGEIFEIDLPSDHGGSFDGCKLHTWDTNACPMSSMSFAEGAGMVAGGWKTDAEM